MTRRGFFAKFAALASAVGLAPTAPKLVRSSGFIKFLGSGTGGAGAIGGQYITGYNAKLVALQHMIAARVEMGRHFNLTEYRKRHAEIERIWAEQERRSPFTYPNTLVVALQNQEGNPS